MYKRKRSWSQHQDFILLDVMCLELAFLMNVYLHYGNLIYLTTRFFQLIMIFLLLVDIVTLVLSDAYHNVIRRNTWQEFLGTLKQTLYNALCFAILIIMLQDHRILPNLIYVGTIAVYCLLAYTMRVLWKEHLHRKLHFRSNTGMLVVTTEERMDEIMPALGAHNFGEYRFVGIVLMDRTKGYDDYKRELKSMYKRQKDLINIKIVADQDSLIEYLTTNWVDEIYIDSVVLDRMSQDLINEIMGMGITVHFALDQIENVEARHKHVEWVCGSLVITASLGYVTQRSLMLKRCMDIAGGIVGCILTGFLTLIIGPMIYIADPGPIFFKQTRIGRNGRKFQIYKFRSMYVNAEKIKKELQEKEGREDELMFKMEHDPRIIGSGYRPDGSWKKGLGGFIRDLSLDEFPQFLNVLMGDMSLVGTRPPTVDEWEQYESWHRSRMSTKPGITGLWQVSGRSTIRDFSQVVQLDREYIENWSLVLDIQILLRTVSVVLARKGAM